MRGGVGTQVGCYCIAYRSALGNSAAPCCSAYCSAPRNSGDGLTQASGGADLRQDQTARIITGGNLLLLARALCTGRGDIRFLVLDLWRIAAEHNELILPSKWPIRTTNDRKTLLLQLKPNPESLGPTEGSVGVATARMVAINILLRGTAAANVAQLTALTSQGHSQPIVVCVMKHLNAGCGRAREVKGWVATKKNLEK